MRLLPGLGNGPAERLAANLVPTQNPERVEGGLLGFLVSPFGTDLEGSLALDGISVWQTGKPQAFDPLTFVGLVRVLDRVGPFVGPALSLHHLQGLAQRAPSLEEYESLR